MFSDSKDQSCDTGLILVQLVGWRLLAAGVGRCEIHLPTSPALWTSLAGVSREGAAIWPDRPTECDLRGSTAYVSREGDYRVRALSPLFLRKQSQNKKVSLFSKKSELTKYSTPDRNCPEWSSSTEKPVYLYGQRQIAYEEIDFGIEKAD